MKNTCRPLARGRSEKCAKRHRQAFLRIGARASLLPAIRKSGKNQRVENGGWGKERGSCRHEAGGAFEWQKRTRCFGGGREKILNNGNAKSSRVRKIVLHAHEPLGKGN
ncbi:hypothetical protein CDAR_193001 [Caerostris darwini]|uniref:Uncharacterized protein n=1 Tax=Caerostris darwini TaxID=1538125 RepID=A0AAV4U0A0_9ARAC|nr:hypothetical protein CDAR_193001 [Caerostris darwini]